MLIIMCCDLNILYILLGIKFRVADCFFVGLKLRDFLQSQN